MTMNWITLEREWQARARVKLTKELIESSRVDLRGSMLQREIKAIEAKLPARVDDLKAKIQEQLGR